MCDCLGWGLAMTTDDWQEVSHDPDFRWRKKAKKLRLYADASVPKVIVDEIRASGSNIPVTYAHEDGASDWLDNRIRDRAHKLGCVLLTFDRDFWQDGQHPLNRSAGIIFVDLPTDRLGEAIDALGTFYGAFARWWPGNLWENQKARVNAGGFTLRTLTWEGKIDETEYRFQKGRWYQRQIR